MSSGSRPAIGYNGLVNRCLSASAVTAQNPKAGTSLGDRSLPHLRTLSEKTISSRFDDSGGVRRARVRSELASVVDVLLGSRQNDNREVV